MNSTSDNNSKQASVVFDTYDPLQGKSKAQLISTLQNILKGQVLEAYLFGSCARGEQHSASDLDIILVQNTEKSFFERPLEHDAIYNLSRSVDLLVYTPKEFESIRAQAGCGFWKSVLEEAIRII